MGDNVPVPHAIVSLSYTDTIQKMSCKAGPLVCGISRPGSSSLVSESNVHVAAQWIRIHAINEMEAADREAQSNQLATARGRMSGLMSIISSSSPAIRAHPL